MSKEFIVRFEDGYIPDPEVEVQSELIRCKDCRFSNDYADGRFCTESPFVRYHVYDEEFCSRAKRKLNNAR